MSQWLKLESFSFTLYIGTWKARTSWYRPCIWEARILFENVLPLDCLWTILQDIFLNNDLCEKAQPTVATAKQQEDLNFVRKQVEQAVREQAGKRLCSMASALVPACRSLHEFLLRTFLSLMERYWRTLSWNKPFP